MKVLLVATADKHDQLVKELSADFELEQVTSPDDAYQFLAREDAAALVIHLDLGEEPALDVISRVKKFEPERIPGIVVVARKPDNRCIIEVIRTGAYDILDEESMKSRDLPHAVRNAAYFAQSSAWLVKRRAARLQEVLVIGSGDGVEAIVILLQASGISVRQAARMPGPGDQKLVPRAIIVDLSAVGDGEALVKLLGAG